MKKVKKYAGGTSEEDISKLKEEGLKASKDDKVGLLDRLRMGNIDDPKSEAYKRFGAGRGLAERTKSIPVGEIKTTDSGRGVPGFGGPMLPKPTPDTPEVSMPVGLRGALTAQGTGEGGVSPGVEGPKVTPRPRPRPRPVAKQNKKPINISTGASGFGTDEKGIAQRRMEGLKAPKTSELRSVARTRAGTAVPEDNSGKLAATMAGLGAAGMGMKGLRQRLMRPDVGGGAASRELSSSMGNRPRLMGLDPAMEADLERMAGEGGPNFKKGGKVKAKPVKKYASSGKVSSASTRADGIAKRGKTKCKVY
jgi:hypothetical protein